MTHGERKMTMPTWPVRFDGVPSEVKSAPLLGEHTDEVLADWLGLDAAAVARLRQDDIVLEGVLDSFTQRKNVIVNLNTPAR
jgi:2-methylfumaryl-CoA isomerase